MEMTSTDDDDCKEEYVRRRPLEEVDQDETAGNLP